MFFLSYLYIFCGHMISSLIELFKSFIYFSSYFVPFIAFQVSSWKPLSMSFAYKYAHFGSLHAAFLVISRGHLSISNA